MPFFKMIENVSRHFSKSKKIRVALLIDEFFGGAGTAYGGYGFLARKFIAKYIPDEDIEIDVLLGKREKKGGLPSIFALKEHCDIMLISIGCRGGNFSHHCGSQQNIMTCIYQLN